MALLSSDGIVGEREVIPLIVTAHYDEGENAPLVKGDIT